MTRRDGLNGPGDGLQEAIETVRKSPKDGLQVAKNTVRQRLGNGLHYKARRGDDPKVIKKWPTSGQGGPYL